MRKTYMLVISCLFILLLTGCQEKPPPGLIPELSEVQSLYVAEGMNTGVVSKVMDADSPSGKEIIEKIVGWLDEAENQGKVGDEGITMTSMPGNVLVLTLTDGKNIIVSTGQTSLLILAEDSIERWKLYDEPLMTWLAYGWKEEIGSEP